MMELTGHEDLSVVHFAKLIYSLCDLGVGREV
jgi:hypothetical protein